MNKIVCLKENSKKIVLIFDSEQISSPMWDGIVVKDATNLSLGRIVDSELGQFEYLYTKEREIFLLSKPQNMEFDEAFGYVLKNLS